MVAASFVGYNLTSLNRPEIGVRSIPFEQFVVGCAHCDLAVFEHDNSVGVFLAVASRWAMIMTFDSLVMPKSRICGEPYSERKQYAGAVRQKTAVSALSRACTA